MKRPTQDENLIAHFRSNIKARIAEIEDKGVAAKLAQSEVATRILQAQAFYAGRSASLGGFSGGGEQWPYGMSNAGRSRTINHTRMRRNARDAYHDSPQARAIVGRYADTVADVGLVHESTPRASVLGITEEAAKEWGRQVDIGFDLWCRSLDQHRSETMTFYQAQYLYQIFNHRDGEIFMRLYYSTDRNLQNPLQWEFLDADQIRGNALTSTAGPQASNVKDGIHRDERGREKAYDVLVRDAEGRFKPVTVQRKGPKSGRVFMLHGFTPEYAGQGRGYSKLGFAIQSLENITDFSAAQIKKAIAQSSIVAMMENKDQDPSNALERILTAPGTSDAAGDSFGTTADTTADDGLNITDAAISTPACFEIPNATVNKPGGMFIMEAAQGDKLVPFAQNAPSESFDKFVDAMMYYLAAAAGIPLEAVLMRFNQNYSASRATLILFWRVVIKEREEWAADNGNPVFKMWLSEEIRAGRIQAPGWSDPRLRAAWLHCTWRGAPMPDIDPSKTAKATREYLSLGLVTGERAARDLNGSDHAANRAQLEHEYGEPVPPPWETRQLSGNEDTQAAKAVAMAVVDEMELRED